MPERLHEFMSNQGGRIHDFDWVWRRIADYSMVKESAHAQQISALNAKYLKKRRLQ